MTSLLDQALNEEKEDVHKNDHKMDHKKRALKGYKTLLHDLQKKSYFQG